MQDYLADRATGVVVEGSKKFKELEHVWTFTLIEGAWRVTNIEEASFSLVYADQSSAQPEIHKTFLAKPKT